MNRGRKTLDIVSRPVGEIDRRARNMDIPGSSLRGFEQLRHLERVTDRHTRAALGPRATPDSRVAGGRE
jgi:hypothetical protein